MPNGAGVKAFILNLVITQMLSLNRIHKDGQDAIWYGGFRGNADEVCNAVVLGVGKLGTIRHQVVLELTTLLCLCTIEYLKISHNQY